MKNPLSAIRRAAARWKAPITITAPDPPPAPRDYDDPFAMPWQPRTAGGLVLKQERERQKNREREAWLQALRELPPYETYDPVRDPLLSGELGTIPGPRFVAVDPGSTPPTTHVGFYEQVTIGAGQQRCLVTDGPPWFRIHGPVFHDYGKGVCCILKPHEWRLRAAALRWDHARQAWFMVRERRMA